MAAPGGPRQVGAFAHPAPALPEDKVLDTPVIRHWIAEVAKSAKLPEASTLEVPSDTEVGAAWDLVALRASLTDEALARHVARHFGLALADLTTADPHARRLLPGRVARKLQVLPLRYSDRNLWVATSDPVSMDAEREIAHVAGRNVHFEIAPPRQLAPVVLAAYPPEPHHEIPPLPAEALGGPRVLVVDDDPDTRMLLRTVLEKKGFRVAEAADGASALAQLSGGEPFDLMTLDLHMRGMQGLDVLRQVRARRATATLPVVVATGADDPSVEMQLFEAGADDFVVKPVDPPRFLLRVQAVLRRRTSGVLG